VLDVFDSDAVRAGHEDRDRVRSVNDIVLEAAPFGLLDVLLHRVDQQCQVVEQRPLGFGFALDEVNELVTCA